MQFSWKINVDTFLGKHSHTQARLHARTHTHLRTQTHTQQTHTYTHTQTHLGHRQQQLLDPGLKELAHPNFLKICINFSSMERLFHNDHLIMIRQSEPAEYSLYSHTAHIEIVCDDFFKT